jgi:cytochrome c biogenesis protein
VNPKANIDADNFSFRGSVNIPEGKAADVVFLTHKDGYLVQKLPFQVQVIDFRVEHYDTGMPKSFESDIILTAPDLKEPIKTTIAVNKPLIYRDYAIYQSSFGDGGSLVKINAHPLMATNPASSALSGEVHQNISINTPIGEYRVELDDYKTNNVIPLPEPDANGRKVKNLGPSLQFRVRDAAGQAVEYENYLLAIDREGAWYQVSKFRKSRAEEFDFLMIPLDDQQSMQRFMRFLARVNDRNALDAVLDASIAIEPDAKTREQLDTQKRFMQQLVNLFRARGFDGIRGYLEQAVEADKRDAMFKQYLEVLTIALQSVYLNVLEAEGVKDTAFTDERHRRFFADAVEAINLLPHYGPPMLFEVTSVEHRESSGLQITKSPGKDVVYFGSVLLTVGIFFLFYIRPQRLWLWVQTQADGQQQLLLAGKDGKDDAQLANLFSTIKQQLQSATLAVETQST